MCVPERVARAPPPPPANQPQQALTVLEHSEDITTFAIKIKEFRGPEDHRHAWDCEALRFFISGEISSTSSAPADTDRIHIQYRHKIQTFVATVSPQAVTLTSSSVCLFNLLDLSVCPD